jgi:hypothetical protein
VIRRLSSAAMIIACSAGALTTAACTSANSAAQPGNTATLSGTSPQSARAGELAPVFMGCLADHGILISLSSVGDVNVAKTGAQEGWYKNGKVISNVSFSQAYAELMAMYPVSPDLKPDQTVEQWVLSAATNGTWPAKLCGALPASR